MEFMFQWFIFVKMAVAAVTLYTLYLAMVKYKFKKKKWNIISGALVVLTVIMPVKFVPETNAVNMRINESISQSKEIPPMIDDTTFQDNAAAVKPISEDDLK